MKARWTILLVLPLLIGAGDGVASRKVEHGDLLIRTLYLGGTVASHAQEQRSPDTPERFEACGRFRRCQYAMWNFLEPSHPVSKALAQVYEEAGGEPPLSPRTHEVSLDFEPLQRPDRWYGDWAASSDPCWKRTGDYDSCVLCSAHEHARWGTHPEDLRADLRACHLEFPAEATSAK